MANEKRKKLPSFVTPAGIFRFPKLSEPDYGTKEYPKPDGEYSVQLIMKAADPKVKAFLASLQPLYDAAMAKAEYAFDELRAESRKKLKQVHPNPAYTEILDKETEKPTGEIYIKAAMRASGTIKADSPRKGQKWERKPVLFDAKGNRMKNVPAIWGGTEGKLSVEVSDYFIAGTAAAGIKLNLNGVQILDLVTAGERSASSLGFSAEDGYEHEDSKFNSTDTAGSATDEGDETANF